MGFSYVDLFAGIGGFHAVLGGVLGGQCSFVSEIDRAAAAVYQRNWHVPVAGDIVPLTEERMDVPEHDVLAAGFPCQPFSKSGFQRGINETRGTLFFNIARILAERRPALALLENVRNLAGPRHAETWTTIIETLQDLGYRVRTVPTVFSPHLLPPHLGGRPQVRDRVFILATQVGSAERARRESRPEPLVPHQPVEGWSKHDWDLARHLPLQAEGPRTQRYALTDAEVLWIDTWQDLIDRLDGHLAGGRLPGFPIWADHFVTQAQWDETTPGWKVNFLERNADFYRRHRAVIDGWLHDHDHLQNFPPSRRKLEWQAQGARSLWDCVIHMRPSGIRAKQPTYLPALVAINQASIIGPRRRDVTPTEAARLQGLPDWFDFGAQPDAATYKQLGNGVSIGAAYYVLRQHVLNPHEVDDLAERAPGLVEAVAGAPVNPDERLSQASPLAVEVESGSRGPMVREPWKPQVDVSDDAVARYEQLRLEQDPQGRLVNG